MLGLLDLQTQIREGSLLPFYIFTGEEIELQNIYLKQMGNVIRVDKVADIYNKITSKLISNNKFAIYVVRDDMDFIRSDKTWSNISNKIRNAVLVVQVTTPSRCKKFIKDLNNCVVEFNHMTTKQLLNVVNMDCSVSNKQYFIEACNNDLNTITNETKEMTLAVTNSVKNVGNAISLPAKDEGILSLVGTTKKLISYASIAVAIGKFFSRNKKKDKK